MRKLRNYELNRLTKDDYKKIEKLPVFIVLDEVRSLLNVGAIFRTCDAFTVQEIILVGITAQPPHKEIEKTALGATETVIWKHFDDQDGAIRYLQAKKATIISMEQVEESEQLDAVVFPKEPIALVFGHEVKGVSNQFIEASSRCIEIPMFGTKHSFNISVSVGITLWHYLLTRK